MALLHTTFSRLSFSNALLPVKAICYNRLSTTTLPLAKLSVEEKLGIKPRPKRPKSTFLRFLSQIKPKLLEDNPKASVTDLNRIAGEKWRSTDESIKENLSKEFKSDWLKYVEDVKAYNRLLSPVQKEEIQKANETITENKKKKKLKQKMEELGKPKKPATSYVLFIQSKVQERRDMPFKEWQLKLSKEWETAPESVKEEFHQKYQRDLEKYKMDMDKWEKRMKKEGHQELIQSKSNEKVITSSKTNTDVPRMEDQPDGSETLKGQKTIDSIVPSKKKYRLLKIVCLGIFTFSSLVIFVNGFEID